jgi:hypothetical protein
VRFHGYICTAEEQYTVISNSSRMAGKGYFHNNFKDQLIYTRQTCSLGNISGIAWKGLRKKNSV